MDWLNYHHLYYFWMAAQEGTVTAASRKLLLSQPTLSAQIKKLEEGLGTPLFKKSGRNLALTETGELVFRYADDIFSLGAELLDTVRARSGSKPLRLTVGISDTFPQRLACRVLQTASGQPNPLFFRCFEGKPNDLMARLAVHELDTVLSDSPVGPDVSIRAFSFLLGESEIALFAVPALARQYRPDFPDGLAGAPFLMPTGNTSLRKQLNIWLDTHSIAPRIEAEFDHSGLMETFAIAGEGIFAAPAVLSSDLCASGALEVVGIIPEAQAQFYAISLERKVKHPGVLTMTRDSRASVFSPESD